MKGITAGTVDAVSGLAAAGQNMLGGKSDDEEGQGLRQHTHQHTTHTQRSRSPSARSNGSESRSLAQKAWSLVGGMGGGASAAGNDKSGQGTPEMRTVEEAGNPEEEQTFQQQQETF